MLGYACYCAFRCMFRRRTSEPARSGFQGVWAAAVTPHRRERHETDFAALLELVDRLGRSGIDGIVLLGTTGEFLNIKLEDRQRLVHLAVKRSQVPIIAGVSHSTLDGAVYLAEAAVDSGAAGLLLMPPYFYHYSPEAIGEFYRLFAIAVGGALPTLIYNIPAFTNPVPVELARDLLQSGEFAGIKDSSGDARYFEALLAIETPRPISVLCGNDRLASRALPMGASGFVSGSACAVPELCVALANAIRTGDTAASTELNAQLQTFHDWLDQFPVPVGIAAATEARGDKVGPPAVPLTPDQFESMQRFKSWFASWLPEMLKMHARSLT